jgi:MFS transporter, DHA2 family, multidrug resistance protein
MRPASFGVRAIEFATGSRAGSRNIGALCLDKICIWLRDNSATGPKGSESLRRERSIDRAVARRSLVQIPKPPAPAARSVAVRSEGRGPLGNRTAITVSIMLATIMQGVDNTIANVALPHIQGSLSAAQDQIAWVLTSYIVAAAITMPLTGWLAGRFGIKYVFLISVGGFTFASALCGSATSLSELVFFRLLQGICGAGLVPLSQSVLMQINPPERHGQAIAVWGIGVMLGPIFGPMLGGWLTENYSWRWIFYINLPVGVVAFLGILIFIREVRHPHREAFDFFGFTTLSIAIGALQMMLDRGELKDWFGSTEIWFEGAIAALCGYLFIVHTATAGERSFLNRDLLKNPNFAVGTVLMFLVGGILSGTLALVPTMLQSLMDYPVFTTGLVTSPRGVGTMAAMFLVGRLVNRIDNRLIILSGLLMTIVSLWQMTGFSLQMGMAPVITSGLLQGFGLGCTFVPLNTLALSNLPRHILTQGTALRSLMRNLGGSIGISVFEALLTQNTQIVHSRLVEHLRPDNPLAHSPFLTPPFSLTTPSGIAALNAEVTRQAAMVAYIDVYTFMMIIVVVTIPLLLLVRPPPRKRAAPIALAPGNLPARQAG